MVPKRALRIENLSLDIERTNQAYYRFVPRQLLALLGKNSITDIKLGDQIVQNMTILFADIRNFTMFSEAISSSETFRALSRLLNDISPIIRHQRGFIDKYLGDGIMAIFPVDPADAIKAALEMQSVIAQSDTVDQLQIGIGIHWGEVALGTVGEPERMDGTVISDAVNTASRVESLTRCYDANMLISDAALQNVTAEPTWITRPIGLAKAYGKNEVLSLHEVLAADDARGAYLASFQTAVQAYRSGDFDTAIALFEGLMLENPNDLTLYRYMERAVEAQYRNTDNWIGVEQIKQKTLMPASEELD